MGEVGQALTRKLGGVPAWAWLGLFAAGMLIYRALARPSAPPAQDTAAPGASSTGPTVPVILAPLATRTVTVAQPPPPTAPPSLSHGAGRHAWDTLMTWWLNGGHGTPPDAAGLQNDRQRTDYSNWVEWYTSHPVGTAPGGVVSSAQGYSVQVYDPTRDGYQQEDQTSG